MTWSNVHDSCPLCEMEPKTHWYYEDDLVVVADAVTTGEPFVVWKGHTESLSRALREHVASVVEDLFGDHQLTVRMNMVEDHWHAHIHDPAVEPTHLKDE